MHVSLENIFHLSHLLKKRPQLVKMEASSWHVFKAYNELFNATQHFMLITRSYIENNETNTILNKKKNHVDINR